MDMAGTLISHMRGEMLDAIQHNTLPVLKYSGIIWEINHVVTLH